jgi:hypothetical protein
MAIIDQNQMKERLGVPDDLSLLDPWGVVFVYCGPCACQIQTALDICRGKGIEQYQEFAVRIDDRIPTSCRRMTTSFKLLSSFRDYIGKLVPANHLYELSNHIDLPWLEQRIYKLEQEAYKVPS